MIQGSQCPQCGRTSPRRNITDLCGRCYDENAGLRHDLFSEEPALMPGEELDLSPVINKVRAKKRAEIDAYRQRQAEQHIEDMITGIYETLLASEGIVVDTCERT